MTESVHKTLRNSKTW